MASFHHFSRLPAELRIMIWGLATESRILSVIKPQPNGPFRSSNKAPSVVQACHEARSWSSYRKSFIVEPYPNYIWTNFDFDTILTDIYFLGTPSLEVSSIHYMRVHVQPRFTLHHDDFKYHINAQHFPGLRAVELLVHNDLQWWSDIFFLDLSWRICPNSIIRIICKSTGEALDEKTNGLIEAWLNLEDDCGKPVPSYPVVDLQKGIV